MGLLQGETVSLGHRQGYPSRLHLLDSSQQCCHHTTRPPTVLERLILAHGIFNRATITDDDEMLGVYLLSSLLCCLSPPSLLGHEPILSPLTLPCPAGHRSLVPGYALLIAIAEEVKVKLSSHFRLVP